ncbi:Uncharacterized protein Rs2_02872 [Raphanus sativus]|nr:Uncharacterized protein Rs2_02872 [Raphanus sativus]
MEIRLADFPSKEEIGCHLLTIQQLRVELEVARVKDQLRAEEVEDLNGNLAAVEEKKVAIQGDLDSVKEKCKRELESRDAAAKLQKKEETDAEIHSQEVRARIEALTEYNEGGFEFDEELARLRRQEILLKVDYGLTSVSDPSLGRLDLPQVSADSINQDRAED